MKRMALGVYLFVLAAIALVGCESVTPAVNSSMTPIATATVTPMDVPSLTPTVTASVVPTDTPSVTPTAVACTLTAQADVVVFQRPSTAATQFGTLTATESVQAMMRTADGWLGFTPGVAQAANVGIFRLRWIAPDAAISREGDCEGLPVAPAISPTACYFMAMADTAVYSMPDENSAVLATIAGGGYSAVSGQTASGWYQLDLQDGSLAQPGNGWLNPVDANFNGVCDTLPSVMP